MHVTEMNCTRLTALARRWRMRLKDAEKNRDEKLCAAAHKALDEIEIAVHEAPSGEGPFAIPTRLVF